MRAKNKKQVNATVDERVYEMIMAIKNASGYTSVSQTIQESVRRMYEKKFPTYQSKPTPIPITAAGPGTQHSVIKERVKAKEVEAKMKDQVILDNGKKVCELFCGEPVNLAGNINEVACRAPILRGAKLEPRAFPIPFVGMPVLLDDDIDNDERTKLWVFENLFDMTLDEPNEKILKSQLLTRVDGIVKGHEMGWILDNDLHPKIVSLLADSADQHGIDTTKLRELYGLQR